MGYLPKITGGSLYQYPMFQANKDGIKFCHELLRCLSRETGFEAVMRIRMSKGFKVSAYYGNFLNRSSDLLALPNCDADKAYGIQIAMEDGVSPGSEAYMQTALLYTTSDGQRRIRVHTIRIPTTAQVADMFASVDEDAMVCLMSKIAADKVVQQSSRGLKDARDLFEQRTVETYRMYRTLFPSNEKTPDRFLYPKTLSHLAVESMALMKNAAFRPGTATSLDCKTNLLIQIGSMGVNQSVSFVYPRLYALHTLGQGAGDRDEASGMVTMPAPIRLSADQIAPEGLYLVEDGTQIIMYVGKLCPPLLLQAVFGINSLDGMDGSGLMLPLLDASSGPMSQKVNNIVNQIRSVSGGVHANVIITKEGEKSNADFLALLIEDRAHTSSLSYADYLCHIHRNSQAPGAH
jgi:protein transport protein SEC24